jgi:hypothetical protein
MRSNFLHLSITEMKFKTKKRFSATKGRYAAAAKDVGYGWSCSGQLLQHEPMGGKMKATRCTHKEG